MATNQTSLTGDNEGPVERLVVGDESSPMTLDELAAAGIIAPNDEGDDD